MEPLLRMLLPGNELPRAAACEMEPRRSSRRSAEHTQVSHQWRRNNMRDCPWESGVKPRRTSLSTMFMRALGLTACLLLLAVSCLRGRPMKAPPLLIVPVHSRCSAKLSGWRLVCMMTGACLHESMTCEQHALRWLLESRV